jgi:hypothetical protein
MDTSAEPKQSPKHSEAQLRAWKVYYRKISELPSFKEKKHMYYRNYRDKNVEEYNAKERARYKLKKERERTCAFERYLNISVEL